MTVDKRYWPICKICNKEVEGFGVDMDIKTMIQIFTARCHGMIEQFTFGYEINTYHVIKGFAFDPDIEKFDMKTGKLIEKENFT